MDILQQILDGAQIPNEETFHLIQPTETYLAWGDHITTDGSDYGNEILHHAVSLELYELGDQPDPAAHVRLRDAMDAVPVRWEKEERIWLLDLQVFCTTYKFDFFERR